jgi:hypothetical protein
VRQVDSRSARPSPDGMGALRRTLRREAASTLGKIGPMLRNSPILERLPVQPGLGGSRAAVPHGGQETSVCSNHTAAA